MSVAAAIDCLKEAMRFDDPRDGREAMDQLLHITALVGSALHELHEYQMERARAPRWDDASDREYAE